MATQFRGEADSSAAFGVGMTRTKRWDSPRQYRIENFGMRAIFTVFVSSCYVGMRKPEEGIYRLALDVTQQKPEECCFIDDRALNLEMAKRLGMFTLEMDGLEKLQQDLARLGVG